MVVLFAAKLSEAQKALNHFFKHASLGSPARHRPPEADSIRSAFDLSSGRK
jgi:hypothetical protein